MSGVNKNVTVQVLSAYICYHGESNEEPKDGHDADKDLFAVSFTQVLGIQVHNGCHKPFDANKLQTRKAILVPVVWTQCASQLRHLKQPPEISPSQRRKALRHERGTKWKDASSHHPAAGNNLGSVQEVCGISVILVH